MNQAEKNAVLENAKEEKLICNITFSYKENYYNLIPLSLGEKLFLCACEDDFILDAYTVRRKKDIRKIKAKNDKCDEILRNEGIVIKTPKVDLDSWFSVFKSLKARGKNIIVEKESLVASEQDFAIGRIVEIHKNFVDFDYFDADGVWGNLMEIPFGSITSVTFGSRYVDIFSKYIGEPPSLREAMS